MISSDFPFNLTLPDVSHDPKKHANFPTNFIPSSRCSMRSCPSRFARFCLISSPYDAYIMEEDRSLASRIVNEYIGLNLSLPPRVTRTSSGQNALALLEQKSFDMVITMPNLDDMDAQALGVKIKAKHPDLPVILLSHSLRSIFPQGEYRKLMGIDKVFIWSGNSDLLLALVKNAEDRLNIDRDTQRAMVRVLILVEDSPQYYSTFLPLIYKEIVKQTQAVLGVGLNEEHRLLRMRSRPKIMLAETYEEAMQSLPEIPLLSDRHHLRHPDSPKRQTG